MNPASHLAAEVASQPQAWRAILNRLEAVRPLLPRPQEKVAVVGCGTSWFMAQAYATLRERSGHGVTDAFTASDTRLARGYDRVVLISRSGTTTEVVEVLEGVLEAGIAHVSFVATPGTPLAELAQQAVVMPELDEVSVVQTRFATSLLHLLRASLLIDPNSPEATADPGGHSGLNRVVAQAQEILEEPQSQALADLVDAEQITFVGLDWTVPLAHEASLKLRESAQVWTESYSAMEYRHGPISIAAPGRVVWALGEVPGGLADQVRQTGAHFEHRNIDAQADLVRVHRLCLARATMAGVDPDNPRNLSRSVVLS